MDVTTDAIETTNEASEQPTQDQATDAAGDAAQAPEEPQLSPFEAKLQTILEEPEAQTETEASAATDEGDGEEAAEEAAVEEAGEGGADEQEGADGADDGAPALRLPGRQPDDPDFEVRVTPELRAALEAQGVDPQQFLERANQLRNEGMRRLEFEAAMVEIETDRQELAMIERELYERPAEFVVERVGANLLPDVARAVLMRLPDDQFQQVLATVVEWEADPASRRLAAAQAREQSVARREQLQTQSALARQQQQYVQDIANAITALVPEDMPDERANEFFDFAVHKLDRWVKAQPRGTRLDPAQVPALLEQLGALAPYGLSANDQAARASARETTSNARPVRPADDPELVERARKTGQDLKRRTERKRLAVTTPAGAGAPAASLAPPKGQSFNERMSWLERRLGLKS